MLFGVVGVEVFGYYAVEHGVAKKLQALVVGPASVGHAHGLAAVHQRELVDADVARVVAGNLVYKNIKLLILYEKEPYE